MLLILAALVVGVGLGLLLGGSLENLAEANFRWWPLALFGLGLQLVPVPSSSRHPNHWLGAGLLLASYAVLLTFIALNFRKPGFPLLAVGFLLNVLVISINGGMPVNEHALRVAYGPRYASTLPELESHGGAKHHLERPDDDLTFLSDVVPVGGPVGNVFSPGDVMAMIGTAWVLAGATLGRARTTGSATRRSLDEAAGPASSIENATSDPAQLAPRRPPRQSHSEGPSPPRLEPPPQGPPGATDAGSPSP